MTATKRQHPRFASRTEVEINLPGRPELAKLWTSDISKGGLFIMTKEPPPLRTRLQVTILLPEGQLKLEGEVVHVVDIATAQLRRTVPGVGLQFTQMGPKERAAVHAFVDGLGAKLAVDATPEPVAEATSRRQLQRAQTFLDALRREDVYGGLELGPKSTTEEIEQRLGELVALFRNKAGLSPAQQTRLETAMRMLERVRTLLSEPESRLDFDFRHGLLLIDDRLRAAPHPAALALLRKVWNTRFPGAAELSDGCWALALRAHAVGDVQAAVRHGLDALESDPFRLDTREKLARWIERSGGDYKRILVLPAFVRI